jgi:hypothetical protein
MRIAKAAAEADFRRSAPRVVVRKHVPRRHVRATAQLKNALAREDALLRERSDLLQNDGAGIRASAFQQPATDREPVVATEPGSRHARSGCAIEYCR